MASPIVPPDQQDQQDLNMMIRAAALECAARSIRQTSPGPNDQAFDNDTVAVLFRAIAFEHYIRTGEIALPGPDGDGGS